MTGYRVRGPLRGQGAACAAVLRALPDWFGIEASIVQYVEDVDDLPTFVAEENGVEEPDRTRGSGAGEAADRSAGSGDTSVGPCARVLGLLAVAVHSAHAAEIHVVGVLPHRHRAGVGSALLAAAEGWLREQGVRYLTVKTLSGTHPDAGYAGTRAFYEAAGFVPLLELPALWGPDNPCLVMLKTL